MYPELSPIIVYKLSVGFIFDFLFYPVVVMATFRVIRCVQFVDNTSLCLKN